MLHRPKPLPKLENEPSSCETSELKPFQCYQCENFKSHCWVNLVRHVKGGHTLSDLQETVYKCAQCALETCSKLVMLKHGNKCDRSVIKIIKWYECGQCEFKTKWKHSLKDHRRFRHESNASRFYCREKIQWHHCDQCEYKTQHGKSLKDHIIRHHTPEKDIKYMFCKYCPYKAKIKFQLLSHMKKHHKSDKLEWFQCAQCHLETVHQTHMNQHMKKHPHGTYIKWFPCQRCDFKTKEKRSLEAHVTHKHPASTDLKKIKCDFCPFQSTTLENLNLHLNKTHKMPESELKWLECGQCVFKTKTQRALKLHLGVHEPAQWLECDQCEEKFKREWGLKEHVATKHCANPQRFKCEQCFYETTSRRNFGWHFRRCRGVLNVDKIKEENWVI